MTTTSVDRPIAHPTIPFTTITDLKSWLRIKKPFFLDLWNQDLIKVDNKIIKYMNKNGIKWTYTGKSRLMSIHYDKK